MDQEDPLEKEMATHCSILPWEIPWTRSLEGHSPWGHKESGMTECLYTLSEIIKLSEENIGEYI